MRSERVSRKSGAARAAATSGASATSDDGAANDAGTSSVATSVGAGEGAAGVTDVAVLSGETPQQRLGSTVLAGPCLQSCAQHDSAFSSARRCVAAP